MVDSHSRRFLDLFREYDDFLDSLSVVCDMGCGSGSDIEWWATLMSRDEPPRPYNYLCYAVDRNPNKLNEVPTYPNVHKIHRNFNDERVLPRNADFIWAHDSLQYAPNPLITLRRWNEQMNVNGMLAVIVPQHSGVEYNRYFSTTHSFCFQHFTPANLIYMLAVNGFDCADAFMLKQHNEPWIYMAVYKSHIPPMDPDEVDLYQLADMGLLHWSAVNSINKHGYIKQEELCYTWLDKNVYFVDYVSQATEIPPEAGEPVVQGIINKTEKSEKQTIQQATKSVKDTSLLKPVGIMRPPKGRYVK